LPAIIRERDFAVYVQFSDHPPPHCHVWRGGELLATVSLLTLEPLFPWQQLPRYIRAAIAEHLDELWDAFNEHNPAR
jgi:Domain of unknown function (DUF4160)